MSLRGSADLDLCVSLNAEAVRQMHSQVDAENERIEVENERIALVLVKYHAEDTKRRLAAEEAGDGAEEEQRVPDDRPKRLQRQTVSRMMLEKLGTALQASSGRYAQVKVLVNTRVPIIKCCDMETSANIDIGYDNLLAVRNTRMLFTYSLLDSRFKALAMIIKHWAKRRSINSTYEGTLSSYAYVLMLLHYLQNVCDPPVLPNLQQLPPKQLMETESIVPFLLTLTPHQVAEMYTREKYLHSDSNHEDQQDRHNVYYLEDPTILSMCWEQQNFESIGSLLFGFFHYWAFDVDFKHDVVCVRLGGIVSKEEKGWVSNLDQKKKTVVEDSVGDNAIENDANAEKEEVKPAKESIQVTKELAPRLQRFWICVEDPFETSHNLGRPVGRDSLYFIRGEFLKALSTFTAQRNYSRQYISSLAGPPAVSLNMAPDLLTLICAETKFKTRDEHKERNKTNMEFSQQRRQSGKESPRQTGKDSRTSTGIEKLRRK